MKSQSVNPRIGSTKITKLTSKRVPNYQIERQKVTKFLDLPAKMKQNTKNLKIKLKKPTKKSLIHNTNQIFITKDQKFPIKKREIVPD